MRRAKARRVRRRRGGLECASGEVRGFRRWADEPDQGVRRGPGGPPYGERLVIIRRAEARRVRRRRRGLECGSGEVRGFRRWADEPDQGVRRGPGGPPYGERLVIIRRAEARRVRRRRRGLECGSGEVRGFRRWADEPDQGVRRGPGGPPYGERLVIIRRAEARRVRRRRRGLECGSGEVRGFRRWADEPDQGVRRGPGGPPYGERLVIMRRAELRRVERREPTGMVIMRRVEFSLGCSNDRRRGRRGFPDWDATRVGGNEEALRR